MKDVQSLLLSECNIAPGLMKVDPVLFVTEWQEGKGTGGYFADLYARVTGRRGADTLSAEEVTEEILRLALKKAAENRGNITDIGAETEKKGSITDVGAETERNGNKSDVGAEQLNLRLESLLRYHRMAKPLTDWFHENARILRWRSEPKPYYVWVSEIMLQQTRVEAVKGYFDRFVASLPDIAALASCPEEKLLKLWEGLGYYNRVRNLQKAAIVVMEQYGGKLPDSYEELCKLPGIGSYTAGAIASIAYGKPAPAVDGNVLRVTKRLMESYDDITKPAVKKEMEQIIRAVSERVSDEGIYPGDLSQALMELGAVVCIPVGKPLCDQCPLENLCVSAGKDVWKEIPVKPAKKERRIEERTIFLVEQENDGRRSFGIRKRPENGLLAGLWELPGADAHLTKETAEKYLTENLGVQAAELTELKPAKHIFSHVEWRMKAYRVRIADMGQGIYADAEAETGSEEKPAERLQMVTEEEMEQEYSLPSAFAKVWEQR